MYFLYSAIPTGPLLMALYSIIIILLIALSRRRRKSIRVSFACAIPQRI